MIQQTPQAPLALAKDSASPTRKAKIWLLELRAPFFTADLVPVLFGAALAYWAKDAFDLLLLLLAMAGAMSLNAGTNMINDFFDYMNGGDVINNARSPFNGGTPFLTDGVLEPRQVLLAALIAFGIGGAIGLYLAWTISWWILPIGLAGGLLGFLYAAPKANLAGRGVGEIAVGLSFGPLAVLGTYVVLTGEVALLPFLAGIPIGLLIGLILYINQFPDMEADARVGKNHWVVRLGRKKASAGYPIILGITYGCVGVAVLLALMPPFALLFLLTIPLALKASKTVLENAEDVRALLPAQAMTIQIHLFGGLLLAAGVALSEYLH